MNIVVIQSTSRYTTHDENNDIGMRMINIYNRICQTGDCNISTKSK